MTEMNVQKPKGKFTSVKCGSCGASREVVKGSWLRKQRLSAGISLREMARRLELSPMYISDVEREKRHCTRKIAQAYDRLNPAQNRQPSDG